MSYRDPEEIVNLTIKIPAWLRARIKCVAVCVGEKPSDVLLPLLKERFDYAALANLQREWIDGWHAQQDVGVLERLYGEPTDKGWVWKGER